MFNLEGATHPVILLQIQDLQVVRNLNDMSCLNGPIAVRGVVLESCAPPGWTPTMLMLEAFRGGGGPWVLCPVAALEDLMSRRQPPEASPALPPPVEATLMPDTPEEKLADLRGRMLALMEESKDLERELQAPPPAMRVMVEKHYRINPAGSMEAHDFGALCDEDATRYADAWMKENGYHDGYLAAMVAEDKARIVVSY